MSIHVEPDHPLADLIGRCLFAIEIVPPSERHQKASKAIREGVKWHKERVRQLEDRNKQLEAVAEAAKAHIDESECIGNVDTNDNCGWCSWCLLRKAALDALKGVHDGRN